MGERKKQQKKTKAALQGLPVPELPLIVTMTRVGKGLLDDDNLTSAFKHVRDAIADYIGVDDGSNLYTWVTKQRREDEYYVEVEFTERDAWLKRVL